MKATSHGESLIQLTRLGTVNSYLVREPDGFTLVDTGLGGSAKALLAAAEERGMPIVRIVLTHAHGDHVGSLDKLAAALPDAEVSIGGRDAKLMAGDKQLEPGEPQAKLSGSYPKVETRPTRMLEPGDRVGSLETVASPGHTPGHVAYLDTRDSTLIAGDAFPHKPTALESARALRALDPSRLAVGHGRVLESPGAEMDSAIRVAEKRF